MTRQGEVAGRGPFDVLVTGVEDRQGLAVVRSLGRAGIRVLAAGGRANSMGFRSRYAAGHLYYSSPFAGKEAMADVITAAVRAHSIPVVIPVTESTAIALDEFRDTFPATTRLALPNREAMRTALDKRRTITAAARLGIPVPRSLHPSSAKEAIAFADSVGFPVIIKPVAQGILKSAPSDFHFKVEYFLDREAFVDAMRVFEEKGTFPLVQQYFAGTKIAVCSLVANGRIAGIYAYVPAREYPYTGGLTSLHQGTPVSARLEEWTTRLLSELQWDGVSMAEYRVNPQTGDAILLELNPRYWGTLPCTLGLGLDFPVAHYRYLTTGSADDMTRTYPASTQSRYFRGDLEGLWRLAEGTTMRGLVPIPTAWAAVVSIVKGFDPRIQSDTMSWSDPLPGLVELADVVALYSRRFASLLLRKAGVHSVVKRLMKAPRAAR